MCNKHFNSSITLDLLAGMVFASIANTLSMCRSIDFRSKYWKKLNFFSVPGAASMLTSFSTRRFACHRLNKKIISFTPNQTKNIAANTPSPSDTGSSNSTTALEYKTAPATHASATNAHMTISSKTLKNVFIGFLCLIQQLNNCGNIGSEVKIASDY